ncbi:DUF4153 domain-containing protein [Thioclava sp. FR2]|uniref:DUF4153 domain-containing protein n=1 Tax=Thioclava sp. FR2 TaxID=3445780 RepID=UPI003EBDACF6
MTPMMASRATMAALGLMAGFALYALGELSQSNLLPYRLMLAVIVFMATFFGTLLIMIGPIRPLRSSLGAAGIAIVVTVLVVLASLRFETVEDAVKPHIVLAAMVLTTVPMPFWIAQSLGKWRDYPLLFDEAWSIVVRYAIAWTFTGVVWAVIFLSDALLQIVGLTVIGDLLDLGPIPFLITGGVLGLGLAVVQELQEYISPYLLLRMLRLILPVVLVVTVVFLVALPLQGFSGLFNGLSVALVMLAMAGVGATLVTTAVDQDNVQASSSTVLIWAARAMSLVLPILAGVGAWAVFLRVWQRGWTPDRVFAAEVSVLGIGYGVLYAIAVLRGAGWMDRIRQSNIVMAFALMVVSALSLTPLLNAEAISSRNHLARFEAGVLAPEDVDAQALERWGLAGQATLAKLKEISVQPGQEALADRLANRSAPVAAPIELLAEAQSVLVLQPETATATRDVFLAEFDQFGLEALINACNSDLPGGGRGCVMIVADLLPASPGEEAVLALWNDSGFASFEGLVQGKRRYEPIIRGSSGVLPFGDDAAQLMREWQAAPPAIEPAPVNRLLGSGITVLE